MSGLADEVKGVRLSLSDAVSDAVLDHLQGLDDARRVKLLAQIQESRRSAERTAQVWDLAIDVLEAIVRRGVLA